MIKQVDNLVVDHRAREWCLLPYPDHSKGCPNYGHKVSCPPQAPLIEDYLDLSREIWMIYVSFDLASHIERMLSLHPQWSIRQTRCVLYWQGKVNKELRENARFFMWEKQGTIYTLCPEAMGVNVIKTAKACGLPIKAKPIDTVYKIALLGFSPSHKGERE